MGIFFSGLMPLGVGESISVLNIAETAIPTKEMVIILLVKMGRLNERTVKLNLLPPKNNGSHPKINSSNAAVAQDQ